MQPLIYYPHFEPPDDTWLKFALLYFEEYMPIVPYNRRHLLSENFRRVEGETDLIQLYAPGHEIGHRASLSCVEEVEKFLANTYDRSPLFRETNILRKWHNRQNWNFQIYQEKFSDSWADFCIRNNMGKRTSEGILLPEELAFMFMTYLAKEIAFVEDAAIITDNNKFDNYTNYARATTASITHRTRFAKGIISLLVPGNLRDIPIHRIVDFRNNNRERLRAFNTELTRIQDKISEGYSERSFIEDFNHIYQDYCKEVAVQGLGITSVPFAMYLLIQNSAATNPEYIKEILGSLGIILGGGYVLQKGLRDLETRRYCKKYLTNLQRLR